DDAPAVRETRYWISGRPLHIAPVLRACAPARAGDPRPTRSAWRSSDRRRLKRYRPDRRRRRCARALKAAATQVSRFFRNPEENSVRDPPRTVALRWRAHAPGFDPVPEAMIRLKRSAVAIRPDPARAFLPSPDARPAGACSFP